MMQTKDNPKVIQPNETSSDQEGPEKDISNTPSSPMLPSTNVVKDEIDSSDDEIKWGNLIPTTGTGDSGHQPVKVEDLDVAMLPAIESTQSNALVLVPNGIVVAGDKAAVNPRAAHRENHDTADNHDSSDDEDTVAPLSGITKQVKGMKVRDPSRAPTLRMHPSTGLPIQSKADIKCGNPDCGCIGHTVSDCTKADIHGFTNGCPLCNGSHLPKDCPRYAKKEVKLKDFFHFFVRAANGKPPRRCPWQWYHLPAPPNLSSEDLEGFHPQRCEFAARRHREGQTQDVTDRIQDPFFTSGGYRRQFDLLTNQIHPDDVGNDLPIPSASNTWNRQGGINGSDHNPNVATSKTGGKKDSSSKSALPKHRTQSGHSRPTRDERGRSQNPRNRDERSRSPAGDTPYRGRTSPPRHLDRPPVRNNTHGRTSPPRFRDQMVVRHGHDSSSQDSRNHGWNHHGEQSVAVRDRFSLGTGGRWMETVSNLAQFLARGPEVEDPTQSSRQPQQPQQQRQPRQQRQQRQRYNGPVDRRPHHAGVKKSKSKKKSKDNLVQVKDSKSGRTLTYKLVGSKDAERRDGSPMDEDEDEDED